MTIEYHHSVIVTCDHRVSDKRQKGCRKTETFAAASLTELFPLPESSGWQTRPSGAGHVCPECWGLAGARVVAMRPKRRER